MTTRPSIRVVRPTTPCYCSVCDAAKALKVRLINPAVIQPGGFALCDKHAEQLGGLLVNQVRRRLTRPIETKPN